MTWLYLVIGVLVLAGLIAVGLVTSGRRRRPAAPTVESRAGDGAERVERHGRVVRAGGRPHRRAGGESDDGDPREVTLRRGAHLDGR